MTDYRQKLQAIRDEIDEVLADGWIPWSGGECPVPEDTAVEVEFNDGGRWPEQRADELNWEHGYEISNIIAYRIIEPARPEVGTTFELDYRGWDGKGKLKRVAKEDGYYLHAEYGRQGDWRIFDEKIASGEWTWRPLPAKTHPPKGTLAWVWDDKDPDDRHVRMATADGTWVINEDDWFPEPWDHYEVIPTYEDALRDVLTKLNNLPWGNGTCRQLATWLEDKLCTNT
jgi:hypothetical protein